MISPKDNVIKALATILWLAMILSSAFYCAVRIVGDSPFESNIMVLLPKTATGNHWQPQLAEESQLQKNFLVLVKHLNSETGHRLAGELQKALINQPGIELGAGFSSMLDNLLTFYRPYRHQLLTSGMREKLQTKSVDDIAQDALSSFYSPVPGFRPYSLEDDPFNLGSPWFQHLFPQASKMSGGDIPTLSENGTTWYLIRAKLAESPFSINSQNAVGQVIDQFQMQHSDADLLVSGFVFHAAEATNTARREITTVGVGSLIGIALLVVGAFRSGYAVWAITATLVTSLLMALAASLAIFDKIHLITLAFGSTLLGLSVDYCFHFLIKCRRLGNSRKAGKAIAKGLVLSAGSSILAYLIQLWSPFPGLQQFAVFIIFGLIGASLSIVYLSFSNNKLARSVDTQSTLFNRMVFPFCRALAHKKALAITIILLGIVATAVQISRYGFSDDIRLLNTSSDHLVDNEIQVNKLLGGIDTQRYWTVAGKNIQDVLEHTEALVSALPSAQTVVSATTLTPSIKQQQQDYQLIMTKLYNPGGALDQLCAALGSDCQIWRNQDFAFASGLVPQYLPSAVNDIFPAIAALEDNHGIVFPLQGHPLDPAKVPARFDNENVRYVDKVKQLSNTLSSFRGEVAQLFMLFVLLFAGLCLGFYRTKGTSIVMSVLVSIAVALALSASGGITLFHILALLLVTGITIDAAIFYIELGLNRDSWLAATLATLTSILAFGLLALSSVPVLQQFGTVVSIGLLCAWLVTPVFHELALALAQHRRNP